MDKRWHERLGKSRRWHASRSGRPRLPPRAPEPRWQPASPSEPRRRLRTALTGMPGVALAAVVIGVAAAWFASAHDLTMLYADARSHLTIARRLVDGPNHSIVQLGTVWLPLPHLAARAVRVVALVVALGCRRDPRRRRMSRGRGAGALLARDARSPVRSASRGSPSRLLLTNPSILYLHTTALTEPVLFAALLGTVAMLARGRAPRSPTPVARSRSTAVCPRRPMVLSRYDGWAMRRRGDGLRARCRAVAMAPVALLDPHRALLRDAPGDRGRVVDVVQLGELGRPARVPARPVLGAGAARAAREGRPAARQGQPGREPRDAVHDRRARGAGCCSWRPDSSAWCCGSTDRADHRPRLRAVAARRRAVRLLRHCRSSPARS